MNSQPVVSVAGRINGAFSDDVVVDSVMCSGWFKGGERPFRKIV